MTNSINFTYEEFYTLLTQVEGILNSHPLRTLSDNPTNLEPLTPGHFIIGEAIVAIPENNIQDTGKCSVSWYHHLQQM